MCLIIGIGAGAMAQEIGTVPRFSFGGGISFIHGNNDNGGYGEFSFLMYHKGLDVRNHIVLRGGGLSVESNDTGVITLSEKISFGGISSNSLFRMYGFVEAGIGLYGNTEKPLFQMPLAYSFGGGGGTDIFLTEHYGMNIEAGWLGKFLDSEVYGGPVLQVGWKWWF
jgi:hypothetical protein